MIAEAGGTRPASHGPLTTPAGRAGSVNVPTKTDYSYWGGAGSTTTVVSLGMIGSSGPR
jgi:hypothetical protein